MNLDFETEEAREGSITFLVPKHTGGMKPTQTPVFYNSRMELNRDLAVLALAAYAKRRKEIWACEPMAGCGVRGIRFAVEVDNVRSVVLNDINPCAARLAEKNVRMSGLSGKVGVENLEANLLLSAHSASHSRFDVVDIDPFGSPAPYLDSAVRAVSDGGLIALTATDMAPLCGVHPEACVRKYGGRPLRTEYCHEIAVRLLLGALVSAAGKHDIGIQSVFSHSTDHYVRAYAVIRRGSELANGSVATKGFILHCFHCFHRETARGIATFLPQICPECGKTLSIAGPLWLGPLYDRQFCSDMSDLSEGVQWRDKRRLQRILTMVLNESDDPTYYVIDRMCDRLGIPTEPRGAVVRHLTNQGYPATPTHFNPHGIRTAAPARIVSTAIAGQP